MFALTLRICRLAVALLVLVAVLVVLWTNPALAQDAQGAAPLLAANPPTVWYLLASGLAMLVPAGFILLAVANLDERQAWNSALGGLAAAGLAAFAYWAVGFALQFGGVGLVYNHSELRSLVWEWSPLSSEWGIGWGMAGLSGWFLSGGGVTAMAYTLFLSHLPWVILAAVIPVMSLRGRAPSTVTLLLALVLGGLVYPLAGNWVQGGGWLNALGRNLNLGHGFLDYGGAGTVHLVAAGFTLAALTVWSQRRQSPIDNRVPASHQPLLAVIGALLILGGGVGWLFANPLQVETVGNIGIMRGAVSIVLAASGGMIFPLIYTWFVTGSGEPTMAARGFAAGFVAGLACGPFVQPGVAFLVGLLAGATVPFVTYLLDGRMRLNDATGVIATSGVPAIIGLLLVGIFADGVAGVGWQATGAESYLGVTGQGVSALTVASGYQADFPGQFQSQVIGIVALSLWGFLSGLLICAPLGLIFYALLNRGDGSNDSPSDELNPPMESLNPVVAPVTQGYWPGGSSPDARVSAVGPNAIPAQGAWPEAPAWTPVVSAASTAYRPGFPVAPADPYHALEPQWSQSMNQVSPSALANASESGVTQVDPATEENAPTSNLSLDGANSLDSSELAADSTADETDPAATSSAQPTVPVAPFLRRRRPYPPPPTTTL
jgi:Amt family ammonium transporter